MPQLSISAPEGGTVVDVLTLDDGQKFVSVKFGIDVSVILDGFDHQSAKQAREIAAGLVAAAADIEATRPEPIENPVVNQDVEACPDCGGMGFQTFDIIVGGGDHDTEQRDCKTCSGTGQRPTGVPA